MADVLARDEALCALVRRAPGRRVPGHVDGAELAVRAVLGQQVSVTGARTLAARLVERVGKPLDAPDGGLTHQFPEPAAIAEVAPADLAMPRSRAQTVRVLASALADGSLVLDPGVDRRDVRARMLAVPGIGPWTADYVLMRGVGDPDAFLPTDLGVRRGLAAVGVALAPAVLAKRAEAWRPWRSYAVLHLWCADAPKTITRRTR